MTTRLIFPMGNSIVFDSRTLGSSRNLLGPRRRLGRGAPSDERQGHSPPELFLSGRQWLAYTREGADGHPAEIWTAPGEGDHDHPRLGNAELFLRAPVFVSQAAFSPMAGGWHTPRVRPEGMKCMCDPSRAQRAPAAAGRRSPRPAAGSPSGRGAPTGRARAVLPWSRWARHSDRLHSQPRFLHGRHAPSLVRQVRGVDPRSLLFTTWPRTVAVVLHQGKTAEPQQRPTDGITVLLNFFDKLRGPKAGQ